jgi:hypothetical protein
MEGIMVSRQDFRRHGGAAGGGECHHHRRARRIAGMTATAVCSVSDDPASLLVCINRARANA